MVVTNVDAEFKKSKTRKKDKEKLPDQILTLQS